MATYSYTSRNNFLSTLAYGNGDSVQYTYDTQGRVTKQTYEDGDTVSYKYDNNGALATVTDSGSGLTTTYYYDFTDRLMKYKETASGYSHIVGYTYDTVNNLTGLTETINGTSRTTSYAYDDDNRVTSVTTGTASESYGYDAYSRVSTKTTKNGSSTVLTDTITYKNPSSTATSGQVNTLKTAASGYNVTYTYGYDNNGNITSVSNGSTTTTYVYDSANQLTRENNQAAGKTWVWTYDDAGNITGKKEYAYTTGTLGTATDTIAYTYGDSAWGDLLTKYDGITFSYDTIGNLTSNGTWTYAWEHGRELLSASSGGTTWTNTYNADGLRTKRTNGSTTYSYVYNGSTLSYMSVGTNNLYFAYDASGTPLSVTYNNTNYYYATNLQGDVTAILNTSGTAVVQYTYDAWGRVLSTTGSMATTLGVHNPLRYRGYVYDTEMELYYLQSRYYDPAVGRFINADALVSTGQGLLGNNMFTYCRNNPISRIDIEGSTDEENEFENEDLNSLLDEYTTISEYGFVINIEPAAEEWNKCIQDMGTSEAYAYMSAYLCQAYYNSYNEEFLFSNECVAYEIEYHVDAYMCMKGYPNYIRNITTYVFSPTYLIERCKEINIVTTDISVYKQSIMFDYYNGIRDCYKNTEKDPYFYSFSIAGVTFGQRSPLKAVFS